MRIKNIMKLALITVVASTMLACKGNKAVIDPTVRLAYEKDPTPENLENLSKAYGSYINKCRKTGMKQPGIYSDYAVTLVQQGKRAEANNFFNKEMEAFPSSRPYVMQLKRKLIPEYQNNNSITSESASMDNSEGMSEASKKAAEERASTVLEKQNNELDKIIPEEEQEQSPAEEKPAEEETGAAETSEEE